MKEIEQCRSSADHSDDVLGSRVKASSAGQNSKRKEDQRQGFGEQRGVEDAAFTKLEKEKVYNVHSSSHRPEKRMCIVIEVRHNYDDPYYRHIVKMLLVFSLPGHRQRLLPFFLFLLSSSIISISFEWPAPRPSSTSINPGPL